MIFQGGKIYKVNSMFSLSIFAVDIYDEHQLVAMFNSYSQMERSYISCDYTFDNLDDFQAQYIAIIHGVMNNAIINKSKDELKQYSHHKLPENICCNWWMEVWNMGILSIKDAI